MPKEKFDRNEVSFYALIEEVDILYDTSDNITEKD